MTEENKKYRFAMIFSGGKDSAIALHRMILAGHEPVCLIVGTDMQEMSYMHYMRRNLILQYGDALGLPVVMAKMTERYDFDTWNKTLATVTERYKAQAVCTGDIAFPYSRDNITKLGEAYGLRTFTPLWGVEEEELVREILKMEIIIKSLDAKLVLDDLLGQRLDEAAVARLHERGLMLNDDTSELHTLAVNGPIFRHPLYYMQTGIIKAEEYSMVDIISSPFYFGPESEETG